MIDGLFDGERRFGWESEDRSAARSQMHHRSQTCEGFCALYITLTSQMKYTLQGCVYTNVRVKNRSILRSV